MWYLMENVQRSYTLSERLLRAIGIGHGGGTRREQEDIEDLIRQGADVNLAHGTFLPLHCACMVGDANSVSILIKWGADVSGDICYVFVCYCAQVCVPSKALFREVFVCQYCSGIALFYLSQEAIIMKLRTLLFHCTFWKAPLAAVKCYQRALAVLDRGYQNRVEYCLSC